MLMTIVAFATHSIAQNEQSNRANEAFELLQQQLLDAIWKESPTAALEVGYFKYAENMVLSPINEEGIAKSISQLNNWLNQLNQTDTLLLGTKQKTSYQLLKNSLELALWNFTAYKPYEWDASYYNIGFECDKLLNNNYAPIEKRLLYFSRYISGADAFYQKALLNLTRPTKEHLQLAIAQNEGTLLLFGSALNRAIRKSKLTKQEKESVRANVENAMRAVQHYVDALDDYLAETKHFAPCRIGKTLYEQKFQLELNQHQSPEEIYQALPSDIRLFQSKLLLAAKDVWKKYNGKRPMPNDDASLISNAKLLVKKQRIWSANVKDSLNKWLQQAERFMKYKSLIDFDESTSAIVIRDMPAYQTGVAFATAQLPMPYGNDKTTYFNVSLQKAQNFILFSTNYAYYSYGLQLITLHEGVPGHCLQGEYISQHVTDKSSKLFRNTATLEGWAMYAEQMMLENGWAEGNPELNFCFLQELLLLIGNVRLDYEIHYLQKNKQEIIDGLVKDGLFSKSEAEAQYPRAAITQVQLSSYYVGYKSIIELRKAYKQKMGDAYNLKTFHDQFLKYGAVPVKYIRKGMLE